MAIVKTLTSFIRNRNNTTLTLRFHSLIASPSPVLPSPSPSFSVSPIPPFHLRLAAPRSRLFFPVCGWTPFSGPLFLARPDWKLLQSATPLYLRGREAIFPGDLVRQTVVTIRYGRNLAEIIRNGYERESCVDAGRDNWKESFFNLPNLISISRMVSGPVLGWMILNEWYFYAFCGLAVSGATDWLDGFVARKMNINSVIGSYLDPLADKILIICVAVAMVKMDLLNSGLVSIVVLRDVALVSGAIFARASRLGWEWKSWSDFVNLDDAHSEKVEPLLISKVNTVLQLLLVAVALLRPELGNAEMEMYVAYLSWLVAATTTASFAAYIRLHLLRSRLFT